MLTEKKIVHKLAVPALLSRNAPIEVIIRHVRLFEMIVVYAMIDNELLSFIAANDFSSVDIYIYIHIFVLFMLCKIYKWFPKNGPLLIKNGLPGL